MGNLEPPYM